MCYTCYIQYTTQPGCLSIKTTIFGCDSIPSSDPDLLWWIFPLLKCQSDVHVIISTCKFLSCPVLSRPVTLVKSLQIKTKVFHHALQFIKVFHHALQLIKVFHHALQLINVFHSAVQLVKIFHHALQFHIFYHNLELIN